MISLSGNYTGISFPFRVGVKGGVAMSSVSSVDAPHLVESLTQILSTRPFERVMEQQIKCEVSTYVFDPTNESTKALISYECRKAIEECDERVEILTLDTYSEGSSIFVTVVFKVVNYENTYSLNVKVGEI